MTPDALEGARRVLFDLGTLKPEETVCIVTDDATRELGELFLRLAEASGSKAAHRNIQPLAMHGQEPPADVASQMASSHLVLGLTERSMAHTQARLKACSAGARYLSLPEYSAELLAHPALRIDYRRSAGRARRVADLLTAGRSVRVVSPKGTDITLDIAGRTANFCPGYVDRDNKLGSPPDIESNVSPVEDASNGLVLVDGSIPYPGFGLLTGELRLEIAGGSIRSMDGPPRYVSALEALFEKYGPKARVLAEFGIGFNEAASLCGNMLMDEGAFGTFHFGFGSNSTVGGKNVVGCHLDFVFYAEQFYVDGAPVRP